MSLTCEAGYPQTDRECAWCGASREQFCRRPPPDPRLAEINKLRAELAEYRQDAERYRWLREKIENDDFLIARASEWCLTSWCGDDPDVYIDAVLAAKGG